MGKEKVGALRRMDPVRTISADILFEIGTEELPATSLADIAAQSENVFELKFKKLLEEHRLSFNKTRVFMTPRRLVFLAEGVAERQAAKDTLTKLMAKADCYDAEGKPTEKFLTILKHRQASAVDTVISDFNGKDFVFIKKEEPQQKTTQILPVLCAELVKSLAFAKPMKWDDSGIVFSRPIRNYLCFYGNTAVKFKIGYTAVAPLTVFFSKAKRSRVGVKNPAAYFKTLKTKGVLLDAPERRAAIELQLATLSKSFGAKLYDDPFLLNEVVFLVESPSAISAPFDKAFLSLPVEVLAVSMARKQRIFGLTDNKGNVLPRFLAVLDGKPSAAHAKKISQNIENILHAKLKDSLFFYEEDTKIKLEEKRAELKNLVFLKGAGSMLEKSDRLARLAEAAADQLKWDATKKTTLKRACVLSKADLLTLMVGEFPELQGVMGKYYSQASGENAAVAEAIGEQYLPRTAGDVLPRTAEGAVLSLLDKLDLVTACYGLGFEPSSSADPYGLRRSAAAVLRIILEKNLSLSLSALLTQLKMELASYISADKEGKVLDRVRELFKDRFRAIMTEKGFRLDVIDSVLASSEFDDVHDLKNRVEALSKILSDAKFVKACKVVERTVNIVKGIKEPLSGEADPGLFTEEPEKKVFSAYQGAKQDILRAISERKYAQATSLYGDTFFDILSEFFEKVFVNAEDLNVRRNRILLLKNVKELYTNGIADLSKVKV